MNNIEIITENAKKTQKIGSILGEEIIRQPAKNKKALVIGLDGELGSGKTTFIQGLAQGLGIKERINSPTFVIFKKYIIRCSLFTINRFYHVDCYRINSPKEIINLDFKEILNKPKSIIVIEWAERIRKILPRDTLWIKFEYLGKNRRRIIIE